MKILKPTRFLAGLGLLLISFPALSQIDPGVYFATETLDTGTRKYRLMVSDNYMVHTAYDTDPAHFIHTMGGFYSMEGDSLTVELEFNSEFEQTGEKVHKVTYGFIGGKLIFNGNEARPYMQEPKLSQPLDGAWLFATRGPDTGQDRRGDENPRKTLKFLMDGYFQWIAYHTESMRFMGSGGGRYVADNGTYVEAIRFFSRDDSRVGAELSFEFERKGDDWHHQGLNSRGEPMYEIWAIR